MKFKELKKIINDDEPISFILKKNKVEEYEDGGRGTKNCFEGYDDYDVESISSSSFTDESWIDSELVITLEEKI